MAPEEDFLDNSRRAKYDRSQAYFEVSHSHTPGFLRSASASSTVSMERVNSSIRIMYDKMNKFQDYLAFLFRHHAREFFSLVSHHPLEEFSYN